MYNTLEEKEKAINEALITVEHRLQALQLLIDRNGKDTNLVFMISEGLWVTSMQLEILRIQATPVKKPGMPFDMNTPIGPTGWIKEGEQKPQIDIDKFSCGKLPGRPSDGANENY